MGLRSEIRAMKMTNGRSTQGGEGVCFSLAVTAVFWLTRGDGSWLATTTFPCLVSPLLKGKSRRPPPPNTQRCVQVFETWAHTQAKKHTGENKQVLLFQTAHKGCVGRGSSWDGGGLTDAASGSNQWAPWTGAGNKHKPTMMGMKTHPSTAIPKAITRRGCHVVKYVA
mmetsp:Transcript_151203/g.264214  ORF Transcript_151203/g.264214 Transcript_151203/m.264214 type:complete len:168 (+) Transcript_151203:225-728(+)